MSFTFAAAGLKADVLAQLATVKGDALATETAELLARHIAGATDGAHTYTDQHGIERVVGYIVKASGHSGGGPASLAVTLENSYFPVLPAPVPAETPGIISGD
jgi:hypothetical protein